MQRDLREVDFTAALPLVSTGSYHRDARYIICCLYEEVWPIPKPLKKVHKISSQTVVFAGKLDKRQPRYRHSETVDFILLTRTLVYWFSTVLRQKNERDRKWQWTSKSNFWTWRRSTADVRCGKWSTRLWERFMPCWWIGFTRFRHLNYKVSMEYTFVFER